MTMMISEVDALELLREGSLLMQMHYSGDRTRWYVVPTARGQGGGQIADNVAERILKRKDVQPFDSGLFPGCEQTFRMRADWRASR
jgi:hypothetical protein